jgi:hypothetical protein
MLGNSEFLVFLGVTFRCTSLYFSFCRGRLTAVNSTLMYVTEQQFDKHTEMTISSIRVTEHSKFQQDINTSN